MDNCGQSLVLLIILHFRLGQGAGVSNKLTLSNSIDWNLFLLSLLSVSPPTAFGVPGEGVTASIKGVEEGAVIC